MGFFSDRYTKPGPGVSKDEPPKKAVPRFFEVFFRKFFDLIKLNLLFCIPVVVIVILYFVVGVATGNSLLAAIPIILLFPFIAGLTIVTRNYAREEHAFIFSDFMEAIKKNWKAFLIDGVICYVVYAVMSIAITYYKTLAETNQFFYVPLGISLCFTALFIWAHFYIPTMIITFDMKLKAIYKNAFIFSIVGLWRNLLLTVILGVFLIAFALLFQLGVLMFIALLLLIIIFFSFAFFLINFSTYPMMKRYMIDPYQKAQEEAAKKEAGETTKLEETELASKKGQEAENDYFSDDLTKR